MRKVLGCALAVLVVAVVAQWTLLGKEQETFNWEGSVVQGRAIEIKGVNGSILAGATSGNHVEVTATKHGRRRQVDAVEIQVVEHDGGVTICAVYPSRSSRRPNECLPGNKGRMNSHNNDVEVDFTVGVPDGVNFVGRTVNGNVKGEDLGGDVAALTVNGNIKVSVAGYAEAQTVNGNISAQMGSTLWSGRLNFETVNGSITVKLPANANTEIEAETVTGDISSDFPISIKTRRYMPGGHASGTLGNGGRELVMETVNGNIRLRRVTH